VNALLWDFETVLQSMLFSSGRTVQIHLVWNVAIEHWLRMKKDAHTSLYSDYIQNEPSR
jgi:hypothetical protein